MQSFFARLMAAICSGLLFASGLANAARPLNTDDANVVDPQSCQNESWIKKSKTNIERWVVPGCNFFADTEISLGANFQSDAGLPSSRYQLVQAKKRWRVLEPDDWGVSTTLGTLKLHGQTPEVTVNDLFLNVPITWSVGQDRFVHLNVGWVKHQTQSHGAKTWGLAFEQPLFNNVVGIVESYGEAKQTSKYQVGLRFWIIPQSVQIDTTLGNLLNNSYSSATSQKWFSVGLRFLSPPLY